VKKLHFSIEINAPVKKVWSTMLDDATYRQWTKAFGQEGYFKGDWNKGSKILFLSQDAETGKESGMVSEIAENRPNEFVSIKHVGVMVDGVEDTTSEEAKKWAQAFENYTFTKKDGKTTVDVDIDVADDYVAMFSDMWPKGLKELKKLTETT
jgi:uncharacterized protein YndB with AHSA1/START domain